ncbi:hypothetical protein [Mesomycoplasma moatsii]
MGKADIENIISREIKANQILLKTIENKMNNDITKIEKKGLIKTKEIK